MRHVALTHKTEAVKQGEARLSGKLAKALRAIGKSIAKDVSRLAKAEEEDERVDRAISEADWLPIAKAASSELIDVAKDGAKRTLAILGIEDDDAITEQTFDAAVEWAKARAAELVGKSWDQDGNLVDNQDAEMAISDTIRDDVRERVAQALEDGDSAAELGKSIEQLGCFSEERALLIARTEIIRSNAQGQMSAMRESGVVEQKAWSTAGEEVCDDCQENEDEGEIDLEDDFPSGDDAPPAHPACRCVVVAVIPEASDDEDDDTEDDEENAAAE